MERKLIFLVGIFLISWTFMEASAQRSFSKGFRDDLDEDEYEDEENENDVDVTTGRTLNPGDVVEVELKRDDESQQENATENNSDSFYQKGDLNCLCGKGTRKIVGGSESFIADIPWTALLYKFGFFGGRTPYCAGTLINNYYVVTASHCVDGMTSNRIEVVLNEQNKATAGETEVQVLKVAKIIMHPEYSRRNVNNDIALLRLAKAVDLQDNSPVAPACLPINTNDDFVGKDAVAAGWGAIREGGGQSKTLRNVTVPVITNEKCSEKGYKGRITENMLCAGDFDNGGRDACQGDSGGPLITEVQGKQMLIGVTSWGNGCGRRYNPGVYARVTRYSEWILSHTTEAEWCG